jgi:hypothetical protein
MRPKELKMQPTIHLERKAEYGRDKYPALPSKCIVVALSIASGSLLLANYFV